MPSPSDTQLPVSEARDEMLDALTRSSVVFIAPTGTGKSTEVPLWFSGSVLIVQPRRVASRAVAHRLAERLGVELGHEVGYRVRDDDRSSPRTRILVVTPGIVLSRPDLLSSFETVLVDELHERRLDTDLICALLFQQGTHFVAMSATLDGKRVAAAYEAHLLEVEGRRYPVEVTYAFDSDALPQGADLPSRVLWTLKAIEEKEGDILVFLPGKAEICRTQDALSELPWQVLPLHGGLSLEKQARVLEPAYGRRVILTTNVAETSLTVSGVRVVVDSGLVRRTAYHQGRSYLTLCPIALDSAEQRAGRAGRTAPGRAIRLWGKRARLAPRTPPEMHRESLVPLVLGAARLGLTPQELTFVDPPFEYALSNARERLENLGALKQVDGSTRLTERGKALAELPLDPWLSGILVQAEKDGTLEAAIALVAVLDHQKASELAELAPQFELERDDCDLCAALFAFSMKGKPPAHLASALREVRAGAQRLYRLFGLARKGGSSQPFARDALLRTIVRADSASAFVSRERKRHVVWINGGSEWNLSDRSRLHKRYDENATKRPGEVPQENALLALSTRGTAASSKKRAAWIELAAPVPLRLLGEEGLGEERIASKKLVQNRGKTSLSVEVERTYCGRILGREAREPEGDLARRTLSKLFLEGNFFPSAKKEALARLARRSLAAELGRRARVEQFASCSKAPPLDSFISERLEELGVESGEDVALLSEADLLPEDVPAELLPTLLDRFPQEVDLGDSLYRAAYDVEKRQVVLQLIRGTRKKPPPPQYLPPFSGFAVFIEAGGTIYPVRR